MKLLSFRIYDYKSIVDSGECELSLEGITVLAGQNEAGKTSILEALGDFDYSMEIDSDARPEGRDDADPAIECTFSLDSGDISELLDKDDNQYVPPERVVAALLKAKKVTLRKTGKDDYSILTKPVLEALEIASKESQPPKPADGEAASESSDLTAELTNALVRQSPYLSYFDSFDGRLPKRKYLSDIENKSEPGYQAVQDFIKLANIDLKRLGNAEDPKKLNNYLDSRSATVTGDFLTYWSQKYDGKNRVEIVAEFMRDDKGPFLSFFVKDGRLRKYPEQRSKGFLWFLSFYLRLNAESQDKEDIGAVILVDEPGSYLHPRAQKDILKVLKNKIVQAGNQVIFSTHSSDLIDPERINRVRLVLNTQHRGTTVHKLTDTAVRANGETEFSDAFSPIVAAIGKDLGKDFSITGRKNVLVEGISDYYYLTTLRDKTAFRIPSDIKIIPMTGAPSISHMVSIMIGWGLDFVVVMDRDDQSDAEYKKLVEELDVPKDKILRIEGGKAIEDLFSDRDFKKFVLGDEAASLTGSKHKSDLVKHQKVILSRQFCEKYKDRTLTLEEKTKENFWRISAFIKSSFQQPST
ncbi:MAG: AAA family ATPase [Enhydrobacter sp.]|nr:MAG: AAA family ATPase [Enhydrobacter sp.]